MTLDVSGDEGAHGDDLQCSGPGVVESGAGEFSAEALTFEFGWNLGVDQRDLAGAEPIGKQRGFSVLVNFETIRGFVPDNIEHVFRIDNREHAALWGRRHPCGGVPSPAGAVWNSGAQARKPAPQLCMLAA